MMACRRVEWWLALLACRGASGGNAGAREMPDLACELATDHGNHYEVLDEARNVVGHIMLSDAAPPEYAVDLQYLFRSSRR